jgi:16S rRNA (guanine966-N2)-methyltransferase
MRIIAGEHRGRRIDAPEGLGTRPMLDRVREALFSTIHADLDGARVLDLFAGSGSLGLEALSRGAAYARFVERGAVALAALKKNVELLGVGDRARVVRSDALSFTSWIDRDAPDARYDLAFFDPPYPMLERPDDRAKLFDALNGLFERVLAPHATLVHHVPSDAVERLRVLRGLEVESRKYGTSALVYLRRGAGA